jgi:hypothetical protein
MGIGRLESRMRLSLLIIAVCVAMSLLPMSTSAYSTWKRWPQDRNFSVQPVRYWIYTDLYLKMRPYSLIQDPNDQTAIVNANVGQELKLHSSSRFRVSRNPNAFESNNWDAFDQGGPDEQGRIRFAFVEPIPNFALDGQGRILVLQHHLDEAGGA